MGTVSSLYHSSSVTDIQHTICTSNCSRNILRLSCARIILFHKQHSKISQMYTGCLLSNIFTLMLHFVRSDWFILDL